MKYAAALLLLAGCTSAAAPAPLPAFFEHDGARLTFTLDLPPGAGPFPAVVMGHGSGRTTRQQLAWASSHFTRLGFAVLRFDKRGVGESTGAYVFVGTKDSPWVFPQLAGDVAAGVRFLRTRPEIDAARIGLFGVSQAGWILPQAARDLGGVAFMILWSGPVCSVGQEMFYSGLVENDGSRTVAEANAAMPSFHGASGYDPVPVLRAIGTPTLWLLGLDDRSIPVQTTLENLQALKAQGRPFEWRTYPELGHGLDPRVWDDIGDWVQTFARQTPSKKR